MVRRNASLKPHLNQIRTWIAEGVTDIWIAHQLSSTPASIAAFRRQHGLLRAGQSAIPLPEVVIAAGLSTAAPLGYDPGTGFDDAPDQPVPAPQTVDDSDAEPDTDGTVPAKRRRRGRRGGRGRRRTATSAALTATLEHSAGGLVIQLDSTILDDPAYRETWAELTSATVVVTAAAITLQFAVPADDASE